MAYIPTEKALRQILVTVLAGATGKADSYWKDKLGTLRPVSPTLDPRSNWKLTDATGTTADRRAIDRAVDLIRGEHPYLEW